MRMIVALGAALGAALDMGAAPERTSASSPRSRRTAPSEIKDQKKREIAEWNAAVERRKAERRHRRAIAKAEGVVG